MPEVPVGISHDSGLWPDVISETMQQELVEKGHLKQQEVFCKFLEVSFMEWRDCLLIELGCYILVKKALLYFLFVASLSL